jgi:hypothetical protein
MDRTEKIDCRENSELIYRATRFLHIKGPGNLFTGSSAKLNGSRSLISTKNGIDSIFQTLHIEKFRLKQRPHLFFPGSSSPACVSEAFSPHFLYQNGFWTHSTHLQGQIHF